MVLPFQPKPVTTPQVSHHLVRVMMDHPSSCSRCYGCGAVADSDEGESWLHWLALEPPSNLAVVVGGVTPIPCPDCGGTGEKH